jgi:hypothetical protein
MNKIKEKQLLLIQNNKIQKFKMNLRKRKKNLKDLSCKLKKLNLNTKAITKDGTQNWNKVKKMLKPFRPWSKI